VWFGRDNQLPLPIDHVRAVGPVLATRLPRAYQNNHAVEVPFLPRAVYHFVATTARPGAVGVILGDRLVRSTSASGVGSSRQVPFEPAHGLTLNGLHHFDLLNHTAIYAKLHEWLSQSARQTEFTG
jgi:hypothetical protein